MSSLNQLLYIGAIEKFQMDEYVFYQGEKGYGLYILLKGKVGIFISSEFDGSEYLLKELAEGDIFGEMSVLSGDRRTAAVKALSDIAVLKINREKFNEFISLEPRYADNLLKTLSKRYFETKDRIDLGGGRDGQ